jgi:diguanylate cyclase (GGDEF)-like protein
MLRGRTVNEACLKLLLVEDNPGDVRLLKECLADTGSVRFSITSAGCMKDAARILHDESFDIILLDLSLPDSHGFDSFISIKMNAPEIPIVLLTGIDDEQLAVRAVQNGAQDYLVKGQVEGSILIRALRYAIERHSMLQELERIRNLEHQMAYYDSLTGLPNRQLFYDRLNQGIYHAERYDTRLALMFLDLDGFKDVNDRHGHNTGDMLLQAVAGRLKDCLRQSDTVARIGGDEFTFVLSNISSVFDVSSVARKIRNVLVSPFHLSGEDVHVSASVGASIYPDDAGDAQSLIKKADMAMYKAKEQGRNIYKLYGDISSTVESERRSVENCLVQALEKNEFMLYYQPQVDIRSGQIKGMEALIRWNHPELGFIPPAEFIPLLEETGRITVVGDWVLRNACRQMKAWVECGYEQMRMAVNLSAVQLRQDDLLDRVRTILDETGLSASYLDFEVTESSAIYDMDFSISVLNDLKRMGSHVSIDDFGTGLSSLKYLKNLPVNKLKIDRSFVSDVDTSADSVAIIKAIIAMAKSMHLEVVAEGVETDLQADFLRSNLCDSGQGFLYSAPVPADIGTMLLHVDSNVMPLAMC